VATVHFPRVFPISSYIEPYVGGRFAMGGFELDPGGAKFVEFEPGRKAALRFADGETTSWELEGSDGKTRLTMMHSGFDPTNPPYPGWTGWLSGLAALHDLAPDRDRRDTRGHVQHRPMINNSSRPDGGGSTSAHRSPVKSGGYRRCRDTRPP
jgi:hypothetical protein